MLYPTSKSELQILYVPGGENSKIDVYLNDKKLKEFKTSENKPERSIKRILNQYGIIPKTNNIVSEFSDKDNKIIVPIGLLHNPGVKEVADSSGKNFKLNPTEYVIMMINSRFFKRFK